MISRNGYREIARDYAAHPKQVASNLVETVKSGQLKLTDISIKHLAEATIPDGREFVSLCDPEFGDGGFQEAIGAVSIADFSNITRQFVYNTVMEDYQNEAFVFTGLVPHIMTKFEGERIPGVGGLGSNIGSEIVDEGKQYPSYGPNEDWIDTPRTRKYGGKVPVTKETVFHDRTNLIVDACRRVGESMGVNHELRIIDAIVDENQAPTLTAHRLKWRGTSYANYQSTTPFINLKASNGLVDWTNIDAALLVASAIVDPNTGLPVVAIGSDLIVCQQLATLASHIVSTSQVVRVTPGFATSANPSQSFGPNPINVGMGYGPASWNIRTSKLLSTRMATKTSWFIGDISRAFCYMENWPITVAQAGPGSDAEFNQDIVLQFKASEKGAVYVKNPRYIVKNTA